MKPTKVKAWPELIGFQPSLPALRDVTGPFGGGSVEVDFSSVTSANSTGVTVFLLRVLRLLGNRALLIRPGGAPEIQAVLEELGAPGILVGVADAFQHELTLPEEHGTTKQVGSMAGRSLPVYRLGLGANGPRREKVTRFKNWLLGELTLMTAGYNLAPNGLTMMIGEIAKNTADHASSDALFGIDSHVVDERSAKLSFVFGDLGIGIKQHIEKNLPPEEEKRRQKMSLYEAYRLALKPGYTSNPASGVNRGHGMSIIMDCATTMKMHLSVFDAASRGLLSSLEPLVSPSTPPPHAAIRRIFHHVGHDVGFFYYGEVTMTRKQST